MNTIVETARKEIGYAEVQNKTKYGKWFGLDGVPWCGIFVSWVYATAKNPLPVIGWKKGFASCQMMFDYALKNNLLVKTPQPGDIVLYDWNKDNRHDHTGIFVRWILEGKRFEAIEGNTSLKNQSNGGTVMLRTRNASVSKFVRITAN